MLLVDDVLFDGVPYVGPHNGDVSFLTRAVGACDGLQLDGRVPTARCAWKKDWLDTGKTNLAAATHNPPFYHEKTTPRVLTAAR